MLKILRWLIGAIFVVPLLLVTYIFYPIIRHMRKSDRAKADRLMWSVLHFLARAILFFFGAKMHVVGRENIPSGDGKYCFIGNHTSMFDIVAFLYPKQLHVSFVGKIEIKKLPIIRGWFSLLDAVYIDRKNPRQSLKAILDGSKMIQSGHGMSIFPEGTRSTDGRIHEFKAGSFKMASRAGGIIVPVVFKGTRTVFEDGHSLLRRPVYMEFLPHIDTTKLDEEELKALPEKVQNMIQEAYDRLPPIKGLVIREYAPEA